MKIQKRKVATLYFISLIVILVSCYPYRKFEKTKQPKFPDYSLEKNWAALPTTKDSADVTPFGCEIKEAQNNAQVDVFYIHPTVYFAGKKWNASLTNKIIQDRVNECLYYQASAFNNSAKIYAPRYRQAILRAFSENKNGPKALEFAYKDIKKAFEHYLKNDNHGRPIIIAGHSQGALHAVNLLHEFFENKPLRQKLVAAYTIGMPIEKNEFKDIPLSRMFSQIHSFITWNTFGKQIHAGKFYARYKGKACVNPLTWLIDEGYASDSLNRGGIPFKIKRFDKAICGAQIKNGMLLINEPIKLGYIHTARIYHVSDFNLFYMNIRINIAARVREYFEAYPR